MAKCEGKGTSKNLVDAYCCLTTETSEARVRGAPKAARKRPSDISLTFVDLQFSDALNGGFNEPPPRVRFALTPRDFSFIPLGISCSYP